MDWSALNIMWTTTALIGCVACTRNMVEAAADYVAISDQPLEGISKKNARIVAGMGVLIHASIDLALLLFFTLGALAITTPPPSRILNTSLIVGFIIVQVALTATSILGNFYRRKLLNGKNGEEE